MNTKEIPIKPIAVEFRDPETHKFLDGDQAWVRIGRRSVINVVQDFEQRNPEYSKHIFDKNGNFEDKDFVKSAYNSYLALSHLDQLSSYIDKLQPVAEQIIERHKTYDTEYHMKRAQVITPTEALLPHLSQIYLGKVNGMNEKQVDFMVSLAEPDPYVHDQKMRIVREASQNGQSLEEIKKYIDKPLIVAEALNYWHSFVTPKQFEILTQAKDMYTIYPVGMAFESNKISLDVGKAIIEFSNKLEDNPALKDSLPYWFRNDGKADIFIALANKMDVSGDEIRVLGDKVLNSGQAMDLENATQTLSALRRINDIQRAKPETHREKELAPVWQVNSKPTKPKKKDRGFEMDR